MSFWQGHRATVLAVVLLHAFATPALAGGVQAKFGLSSPSAGPFPSDAHTVLDPSQRTGVRVNLPKPATCPAVVPPPPASFAVPTDCYDIDELNTLDGFNLQPRVRVPFTGAIDPNTVAGNVFFVRLAPGGGRVEVNQVVWDATTLTLFAESDQLLDQSTRYALIVTNGVRDAAGDPVEAGDFATFRHDLNFGQTKDPALKAYRKALLGALDAAGADPSTVVTASVFTTQSATAVMEKIRDQAKADTPTAVVDALAPRAPGQLLIFRRQIGTDLSNPSSFSTSFLPLDLFDPGRHIGTFVFGHYGSRNYLDASQYLPAVGTLTGTPVAASTDTLYFNLWLPAGTPPASGWPVAIFGHGFTDSKQGAPLIVAGSLAAQGIASIAINVVGHGGGPAGTLTLGTATVSAGGRGIDQNGDGRIDSTEGVSAAFPHTLAGNRDGLRQTVADILQLVRVLETNAIPGQHFDLARIFYAGQSFGGIYGTKLMALEPSLRAGVVNVPGGPIIEVARLSPSFRFLIGFSLFLRVPSLANRPPAFDPAAGTVVPQFFENIPFRDVAPVINTDPTVTPIQEVIDNTEWASQAGNPVAYAPHILTSPLEGMQPKPVIVQFAKGDQTVPNPTASALLRAGDLHDHTSYFRNDLAFARDAGFPKNPHTFLTHSLALPGSDPNVIAAALAAQAQIATFFASNGTLVVDPDGADVLFEVPISPPEIPSLEQLNFIP
jgi:dienelactone hydrolase